MRTDFLASGGYGDVFRGVWEGAQIAIKRFSKRSLSKKAIKDFIKEVEILNQLRHPNIVYYLGLSIDSTISNPGYYYMITEFVGQGSLF